MERENFGRIGAITQSCYCHSNQVLARDDITARDWRGYCCFVTRNQMYTGPNTPFVGRPSPLPGINQGSQDVFDTQEPRGNLRAQVLNPWGT